MKRKQIQWYIGLINEIMMLLNLVAYVLTSKNVFIALMIHNGIYMICSRIAVGETRN